MTMDKFGVIYLLTNQKNGKQYVGQTVHFDIRICEHKQGNEIAIDRAIDKHGWNNFEVKILEDNIPKEKLDKKEKEYINKYDTFKGKGYNCTEGGDGRTKGLKMSKEAKEKMSEANSGKNNPNYGKTGKDAPMYGKQHTKEAKEKMSEALAGREFSKEHRQNLSKAADFKGVKNPLYGTHRTGKESPMYGKNHTKETKRKMSETSRKISEQKRKQIKRKYEENKDILQKDLAEEYDVDQTTISRIIRGE